MTKIRVFAALAVAFGLPAVVGSWPVPSFAQTQPGRTDRALVASVQELLAALGYDAGPADGVAGQRTRQAIVAFQRAAGMTVDGRASEALYHRLTAALNQGSQAAPPQPQRVDAVADRGAPEAAPAAPPPAAATPAIPGPRWRITDEETGASVDLVLEPGGRVGGLATARFWRWELEGATLRLLYDNGWGGRVVRVGRLDGDRIAGTAETPQGRRWTWRAVRLVPARSVGEAAWAAPSR